ncbi:enoyl-CoA hydratase-related protein [Pandoraea pnomenusa]|uniref:enoyl-CoA hydratase-related protein n=1 Tax=Pandoraea pnomenusa TaxID=93220 RepID=UPI001CB8FEC8|nr:enoyl-CoA hydratase-related protein [Pandoraea pnomenusa]
MRSSIKEQRRQTMELHVTESNIEDGVAVVRLSRPGRGNSWTKRMNEEYRWLMASHDADPAVRVIVVTGAGRQFCVGADFKALDHYVDAKQDYVESINAQALPEPGHGVREEFDHEMVWHWGLQKPVIAAINGACAGIAVALASFCDLRYCVKGAKITTSTPRLGLPAEYGLAWILPRIVGLTHAMDILVSGRVLRAEEADRMGWLNGVFDAESFESKVMSIAMELAKTTSPLAVKTAKRQIYAELLSANVGAAVEDSKRLIGQLMKAPDYLEGVKALQEGRVPSFAALAQQ